jgi:DnaJ-class molecular chaperone
MSDDVGWTFLTRRTCTACKGTGKPPSPRNTPGHPTALEHDPLKCPTCQGRGNEERAFSVEQLRELLSLTSTF